MKKLVILSLLTGTVLTASQNDFCKPEPAYWTVTFADGTTGSYPRGFMKQLYVVQQADEYIAQGIVEDDFKNELDLSHAPDLSKKDFDTVMTIIIDPTFKPKNLDQLLRTITAADRLLPDNHYITEALIDSLIKHMRTVSDRENFCKKLTNRHASLLINKIKKNAIDYHHFEMVTPGHHPGSKLSGWLYVYMRDEMGPLWEVRQFPVPNYQEGHPTLGSFPLSIQDLIDANAIPRIVDSRLSLAFEHLTSLHGLSHIQNIQNIEILELAHNSLTTIPVGIFSNLPALRDLSLEGNPINQTAEQIRRNNNLPANCRIHLQRAITYPPPR